MSPRKRSKPVNLKKSTPSAKSDRKSSQSDSGENFSYQKSQSSPSQSSQSKKKPTWIIGFVLALFLLGLLGWGGYELYKQLTTSVPAVGGTLTEGLTGQPQRINPLYTSQNPTDRDLSSLIYPSLFSYSTNGSLQNDLVKSTKISSDATTYTFTLKSNPTWEDGTPITAQDIAFTIKRIQNKNTTTDLENLFRDVEVQIQNKQTITLNLPDSYSPFKNRLTFGILPQHIWKDVPPSQMKTTSLNLNPVGGGPFSFEQLEKSDNRITRYVLTRNESYYGKTPYIDTFVFRFYPNTSALISAYKEENVDTMLLRTQIAESFPDSQTNSFEMSQYFALFFNMEKSLFENDSIRKALRLAIDKPRLVSKNLNGTPLNGPLTATNQFYVNQDDAYDPETAKQILSDNGWKDTQGGDGIREKGDEQASFTIVYRETPQTKAFLTDLQKEAKNVGIEIRLEGADLNTLRTDYIQSQEYAYDAIYAGQALEIYPDPYIYWHSSQITETGFNLSQYSTIEVDKFLETIRTNTDPDVVKDSFTNFQKKIHEDIPALFTHSRKGQYYAHEYITNLSVSAGADTSTRFKTISDWYLETKRVFK